VPGVPGAVRVSVPPAGRKLGASWLGKEAGGVEELVIAKPTEFNVAADAFSMVLVSVIALFLTTGFGDSEALATRSF
jgi:hypothetical protein